MPHATLFLHFPLSTARALAGALAPETASGEVPKTRATCALDAEGALRIDIDADDLSSLRAAVNSYLRWADAAERAARLAQT